MSTEEFRPTRRTLLGIMAGLATVVAAPTYARAPGLIRGAGDFRRIRLTNQRTGESLDTVYYANRKYIPEALTEVSYFMRDWRENEVRKYDARNVDILATTLRMMDTTEPYLVISGYRTAKTNRMLRGAARDSYHIKAMAADVRHKSRSVSNIYKSAMACDAGGVGFYGRSNFIHMDCGPVRTWNG